MTRGDQPGRPANGALPAPRLRGRVAAFLESLDHQLLLLAIGAALFVGLSLLHAAFGRGVVAGADVTGHLVRTDEGFRILGSGHTDGWSARFGAGYPLFLFYGPGYTLAVAAIRLTTLGFLSTVGATNVIAIASLVATPIAAVFTARSFGLSLRAAGLVGVLGLAASSPFGVGLEGQFGNGLLPQQLAAIVFFLVLGAAMRTLTSPEPAWTLATAVLLSALLLTHLITVAILATFLACIVVGLAVTRTLSLAGLAHLAVAGAVAVGLSSFWLVPFLVDRNLHGPVATWGTPPFGSRIGDVVSGRLLFRPLMAKAVLAGVAYGFVRIGQRRPHAVIVALLPVTALAIGHWLRTAWPNEMTLSIANRELGLVGILWCFPLAAALADLSERVPWSRAAFVAVVVGAAWLVIHPFSSGPPIATLAGTPNPDAVAAAHAVADLVPRGARFVTVRDYPTEMSRVGAVAVDRWFTWASGRDGLALYPLESSNAPAAANLADTVMDRPRSIVAAELARFGVTHAVVTSPQQAAALDAAPGFRPVWRRGSFSILEISRPTGPAPASQITMNAGEARLVASRPGHLRVLVRAPAATRATVAVAWSPRWHARVDGRPVALHRAADGLTEIDVPRGAHELELTWRQGPGTWIGAALTLATIAALALGVRHRRRR